MCLVHNICEHDIVQHRKHKLPSVASVVVWLLCGVCGSTCLTFSQPTRQVRGKRLVVTNVTCVCNTDRVILTCCALCAAMCLTMTVGRASKRQVARVLAVPTSRRDWPSSRQCFVATVNTAYHVVKCGGV